MSTPWLPDEEDDGSDAHDLFHRQDPGDDELDALFAKYAPPPRPTTDRGRPQMFTRFLNRFRRHPRVAAWAPIDRIPTFRLGQWAALIDGYDYPRDWNDDPGFRPWRDTFFFLKRSIQAGEIAGVGPKCDRTTLVPRAALVAFYEARSERPRALFPEAAR